VLVVEDNADARAIMVILLEQWGYKVWSAADGREGIERARATCPDIALVDIGLPGVDGYGVAHALRSSPETEGIWLVALTGHAENPDREQAGTARFDLHLTKPVDPGHLRSVLAELLQA
jgi:CheY-like chemotaxis protein